MTIVELQEKNTALEAEVSALEKALQSEKDKLKRKTADYKSKIKSQLKALDEQRQKDFEKAKSGADRMRRKAKKIAQELRSTDLSNIGIPAQTAIAQKLELLQKLFGKKV